MLLLVTECFLQGKRCLWGLHTDMLNRSEALRLPSFFINLLYSIGSYFSDVTFTTSYVFKDRLKSIGFNIDFVMDQDFKCEDFKVKDNAEEISRLRNNLLAPGTKYVALYAGRLSNEKRIELLFPALPDNVTLVIVGDGPEKENIFKLQKSYRNVKIVAEMVPQHVLRKYYKASDLHVSASDGETYGMTVREALYCKTAVVVQNDGGFLEQVRPGVDGFLVDFSDIAEAKAAIKKACKMLPTFNPSPRHNEVVDLPKYIVNQEYKKIEPFSRIRLKKLAYFGIALFQYIMVIGYYIVQTFYSRFVYSHIKKFQ